MSTHKIPNLESLVASFLPKAHFIVAQHRKLTSSGDNYGSVLLSVDILVRNEHNQDEHIHAVAKKLPCNELIQEMFNSQCTFPNEVGFYQTIAPCLREFQHEKRIPELVSSFPDFYTARISKHHHKIDESSVLLIKNIKKDGFEILDRTVGFDLKQCKLVLTKMAEVHATAAALKLQQPTLFQEKVVPFFEEYETFVMDDESNDKMIQVALDVVRDDVICKRYLPRLEEIMKDSSVIIQKKNDKTVPDNHFFTLVHSDMWTNNIMVKIIDGEIVDVKFVDYQLYEYTSLTRDVVFFLYSSVKTEVLKEGCDYLLRYYYDNFIDWMKKLDCDVKDFSFEGFIEDMKAMVKKFEFFHVMTMLPPIYATSKDTKDVEQLDMDNLIFVGSQATETCKEKACFVVEDFIQRGWLL